MYYEENKSHPAGAYYLYIAIITLVFLSFTVVFIFFPRSRVSELEKRELAQFPKVKNYNFSNISRYPSDISHWFSDTEPYRDKFMNLSMILRDKIRLSHGKPEEQISFKAAVPLTAAEKEEFSEIEEMLEAAGNPMADANATVQNSGTIVVGTGDNVRALMAFGASVKTGENFVNVAKKYAEAFPDVNIYALIPPSAAEFYLPDKGKSLSNPEKPVLDYIESHLPPGVKMVDAYKYLAAKTYEDIYLRTDHHWSPLGAFYGAKAFAKTAGVPFKELDSYDKHIIKRFVGSMYGYTKDIAVKNAPEDFVYYTPKGLGFTTTYVRYSTNGDGKVTADTKPYTGEFFHKFKDGSSNAYLTFMGGDQYLVKVSTGTPSDRKLLIIKDSYGNPVPGYLFYSFGEVHVVDFRYFPQSMKSYVKDNGITDILFVFNIFNAVGSSSMGRVTRLLEQSGGNTASSTTPAPSEPAKDNGNKTGNETKESPVQEVKSDEETQQKPEFQESIENPGAPEIATPVISD